jgi:hypothetical protein
LVKPEPPLASYGICPIGNQIQSDFFFFLLSEALADLFFAPESALPDFPSPDFESPDFESPLPDDSLEALSELAPLR